MFGSNVNVKKLPKAVVRKVTVARPADQHAPNGTVQRRPLPSHSTGSAKHASSLKVSRDGAKRGGSNGASANGYLSVARRQDSKTASPSPSLSPSRRVSGVKRKTQRDSPSLAPDFGSSSEDEGPSKRMRPSPRHGTLEPDTKRVLLDEDAIKQRSGEEAASFEEGSPVISGYDLTFGKFKEYNKYLSRTGEDDGEAAIAELQYPSRCARERFQLVLPSDKADYNPIDDIVESIIHICKNYFQEEQADFLTDDITGYPRRFTRANTKLSGPDFLKALDDFNEFIVKSLDDGTISNFIREKHSVNLQLVERILSQTYARTVSPHVNSLKEYENGTDDVYGELLPRFVHQIFQDTNLRSDQVFVDLGSGVGNVVLQAALEIGCEAWGVEKMPNPASLAAKQLTEFVPRCKRWSLKPGKATVIHGDFLTSQQIDDVLRRADVVLVNNQAFTPELNGKLTMKFMDLKDGCKIVSLRSFLPENWQMRERNLQDPRNLLSTNVKKEYFSESVSWTGVGGNYYVAMKDTRKVDAFVRRLKKAEATAGAEKTTRESSESTRN